MLLSYCNPNCIWCTVKNEEKNRKITYDSIIYTLLFVLFDLHYNVFIINN